MSDVVNRPKHYETGNFECIDVMLETQGKEAVKSFCLCNAFKYLYRHNRKNGVEDIKKAKWYIDKYLELSQPPIEEKAPETLTPGETNLIEDILEEMHG